MKYIDVGGGPIGIEAALSLTQKGYDVMVIEMGPSIASNIELWRDVTLFSPNSLNMSTNGIAVLNQRNFAIPNPDEFMTGGQFIDRYLRPLESHLLQCGKCSFLYDTKVLCVAKEGLSKGSLGDKTIRAAAKFNILVSTKSDVGVAADTSYVESYLHSDAVVDATGTYNNPNYAGAGGLPALGELSLRQCPNLLSYYIANPSDITDLTANTVVAVLGSGTSAITSLKRQWSAL